MRFSTGQNKFLTIATGLLVTVATGMVCFENSANANDGVTSNAIIHRAGLRVEWFTHAGVGAKGQLTDWHLNVNENKSTTFFAIKAGSYLEKFSQHTLSPFGKPYGIEGAEEYAAVRVDILKAEFENDGIKDIEIKVDKYTLPETTIYVLTSDSVVKAIDGDTGEIKWSSQVGNHRSPSIGIGSSNDLVAVANGSSIYCLESETGKLKWTKKCISAPAASPTVSDQGKVYVPLLDGRLETMVEVTVKAEKDDDEKFELDGDGKPVRLKETAPAETYVQSYAFVSKGRGTARAVVTEKTVAWPTSNGDLNVAAKFGKDQGVAYQLRSGKAIVSPPAFKAGMFFVTSLDGFVYAVDEERGTIVWEVSTGGSVSQSPIPLGNHVFVINNQDEMFKFDAKTGDAAPGWTEPMKNIERFVGAGQKYMYIVDRFGELKVVSQDSGSIVSSVRIEGVQSILPNLQSDRLYVASDRGMIQCIREIGSAVPHFHSNEFVAVEVDPQKADAKTDETDQPAAGGADLDDPFRSSKPADNPFGGAAKPADTGNPFGGTAKPADDSNPFDTGGAAKTSEPDDKNPFK